jgi:hypothetical protein
LWILATSTFLTGTITLTKGVFCTGLKAHPLHPRRMGRLEQLIIPWMALVSTVWMELQPSTALQPPARGGSLDCWAGLFITREYLPQAVWNQVRSIQFPRNYHGMSESAGLVVCIKSSAFPDFLVANRLTHLYAVVQGLLYEFWLYILLEVFSIL